MGSQDDAERLTTAFGVGMGQLKWMLQQSNYYLSTKTMKNSDRKNEQTKYKSNTILHFQNLVSHLRNVLGRQPTSMFWVYLKNVY